MSKQDAVDRINMVIDIMGIAPHELVWALGSKWKYWEIRHLEKFREKFTPRLNKLRGHKFISPKSEEIADWLRDQIDLAIIERGDNDAWLAEYLGDQTIQYTKIAKDAFKEGISAKELRRSARYLDVVKTRKPVRSRILTFWRMP